jgi:hypothetical protein
MYHNNTVNISIKCENCDKTTTYDVSKACGEIFDKDCVQQGISMHFNNLKIKKCSNCDIDYQFIYSKNII